MPMLIHLDGERFGRLLVKMRASPIFSNGRPISAWLCHCDCGKVIVTRTDSLRSGKAISCGCQRGISNSTHGLASSKVYNIWQHMKKRCFDASCPAFVNYGGRGITVCTRWLKFENFLADMGIPPDPNMSIDRINNNGNYDPSNCRWATRKEQNNNTRANRPISFQGRAMTASQWSEETGIHPKTIYARIFNYGWLPDKALTAPVRVRNLHVDIL